ncbi:MAG TPA: ABC transporter substrate-binding protein [Rubrivivax sp.]|nr:ABC transporter substrate-binding protein [Burkholderiales bacterium]HNT40090.1 ABC transporter substrate-binding protein [Rubrivivax sp.]
MPEPSSCLPPAPYGPSRRSVLLGAAAAACLPLAARSASRRAKLVLAGPMAAVSYPLMLLAENGALAPWAEKVEFVAWKDPDQLRLLAIEGKADFVAVPTNVAANLFNRGVRLALLNVSTWGILWILSRRPGPLKLSDLKGQELLVPFRGDMPDIVLQLLAAREGIDLRKDMTLRYVASPLDAMQMLLMRQADHALLAEPAASMALRKTQSFPMSSVAPELYRAVDMQSEWGRVLKRAPQMPQAGICVLGQALSDAALRQGFQQAYTKALADCEAGPDACGVVVERHVPQIMAAAVADAVRADNAHVQSARDARAELEFFFQQLLERQPGLVGGAMPGDAFYGG